MDEGSKGLRSCWNIVVDHTAANIWVKVLLADEAEKVEVCDWQLTKKIPQLTQNLTEEEGGLTSQTRPCYVAPRRAAQSRAALTGSPPLDHF